jgi:type IV pilus assembly protein PilC
LEDSLNLISNYMERQANLSRKVTDALRYPAMVAVVALVAGYILITYSLPSLTSLLSEFGGELPVTARLLIGFTENAQTYSSYVPVAGGTLFALYFLYTRTRRGARQRDQVLLKLPVFGKPLLLSAMFRFTKTLHTTLSAGLPLLDAMDLTMRVEGNIVIRESLAKVRDALLNGEPLSKSIAGQPVFPTVIHQMIAAGEQTGTMTQNLDDLATFFDREAERSLTGLASLIEPVLIIVVGGGVALLAVTIMSALYGTIGRIQ